MRISEWWIALIILGLAGMPVSSQAQIMSVQTQGHHATEGKQGGIHPALSIRSTDYNTVFGAGAGYMLRENIELGAELYRFSYDNSDLSGTAGGPFVAYYPHWQTEGIPVSVRLGGAYVYSSTSGNRFFDEASGSALEFTAEAFHYVDATPKIQVAPFFEVGVLTAWTQLGGRFDSAAETSTDASFELGVGIGFKSQNRGIITVAPSFGNQGGETWFAPSVGYLLSSSDSEE
jgi:hypothetical protein